MSTSRPPRRRAEAFFTVHDDDTLVPLSRAASGWGGDDGPDQLRGTAVSGVMARAAERAAADLDDAARFRPVRWTVDLFRPGALAPATTSTTVVRRGRRLRLVDATFTQDGRTVARGSLLLLATGGTVVGAAWPGDDPAVPPAPPDDLLPDDSEPTLYRSGDSGWTVDPGEHRNAAPKAVWFLADPLVDGEDPTPLQHAAVVADAANLTVSWGTGGVGFINADLTLALRRLPAPGAGVGLVAASRHEHEGVAVGRTTMFDAHGPLGTVTVSTLANGDHPVDPGRDRARPRESSSGPGALPEQE